MSLRRPFFITLMRLGAIALATASVFLSIGCASRTIPPSGDPNLTITGGVHGGQQPIAGAQVYLYEIQNASPTFAAVSLLPAPAVTGADGSFAIDRTTWSCIDPWDMVYFAATGGDAGGGPNSNIVLMTLLQRCGDVTASTLLSINEATTVAAAYTMAALGSSGSTTFSTSTVTDPWMVYYGFNTSNDFADPTSGETATVLGPTNTETINALANAAAACVNTSTNSGACQQLFLIATPPNGTAPQNTFTALVNIAGNPSLNVSAIFDLVPPIPPFQPTLSVPPSNWGLAVWLGSGNSSIGNAHPIHSQK